MRKIPSLINIFQKKSFPNHVNDSKTIQQINLTKIATHLIYLYLSKNIEKVISITMLEFIQKKIVYSGEEAFWDKKKPDDYVTILTYGRKIMCEKCSHNLPYLRRRCQVCEYILAEFNVISSYVIITPFVSRNGFHQNKNKKILYELGHRNRCKVFPKGVGKQN